MGRTDGPGSMENKENIENKEPSDIPAITTEQMIYVDRAMVDDYGIDQTRMSLRRAANRAARYQNRRGCAITG